MGALPRTDPERKCDASGSGPIQSGNPMWHLRVYADGTTRTIGCTGTRGIGTRAGRWQIITKMPGALLYMSHEI